MGLNIKIKYGKKLSKKGVSKYGCVLSKGTEGREGRALNACKNMGYVRETVLTYFFQARH